MQCTHCNTVLTNTDAAHQWPLSASEPSIWPQVPHSIAQNATRLLGQYAALWGAHQPIHTLLTQLSQPITLRLRSRERYEVRIYPASQLNPVCQTALQEITRTQSVCDLNASFVVCLKRDAAAVYCMSDFLGAAAFAKNEPVVGTIYDNPLFAESSTDAETHYAVPMAAGGRAIVPTWNGQQYEVGTPRAPAQAWPSHYTAEAQTWSSVVYETGAGSHAIPLQPWSDQYTTGAPTNTQPLYATLAQQYEQFIVVFAYKPTPVAPLPIRKKHSWRKPFYLVTSVLAAMATIAAVVAVTRRGGSSNTTTTMAPTGVSFNPNVSAVGFQPCYPISMAQLPTPQVFNLTGLDPETQEVVGAMANVTTKMVTCAISAPLNVSAPSFALSWPTPSASWQRTISANLTDVALQLMPQNIPPWYFNLTSLCVWCSTDTALLLDAAIAQNQVRVPGNLSTSQWSYELANQLCTDLLTCAIARQGKLPNATTAGYGRLLNRTLNRFNPEFANSTLVSFPGTRQNLPSFMYNLGLSIYTRMMEEAPSYVPTNIVTTTAAPSNATTTTSRTATTVTATTQVTTTPTTQVTTTTDTPSTLVLTTSTPTTTTTTTTRATPPPPPPPPPCNTYYWSECPVGCCCACAGSYFYYHSNGPGNCGPPGCGINPLVNCDYCH